MKFKMSELLGTISNSFSAAQNDIDQLMSRVEQQQNMAETELLRGTQLFISLNRSGAIDAVFRETMPSGKPVGSPRQPLLSKATHIGES